MQTWLDGRIRGEVEKCINTVLKMRGWKTAAEAPRHIKLALKDDLSAFKVLCEIGMQMGSPQGMLSHAIWPLLTPSADGLTPIAAQLEPKVVDDFIGVGTSQEVKKLALEICAGRVVYIDLPRHAFPFDLKTFHDPSLEGEAHVRAIFLDHTADYPRMVLVIEGFYEGGGLVVPFLLHDDDRFPEGLDDEVVLGTHADALVEFHSIAEFVLNVIAFIQVEGENRADRFPLLPSLPIDHPRRRGRKAAQIAKKYSLFSVAKLSAADVGRPRGEAERRDGPPLPRDSNRRHTVKGHFRLQAYGPSWSKRRLRWIAGFDRGDINSVPLTKITRLAA